MRDLQDDLKIMNHKFNTTVKENYQLKLRLKDMSENQRPSNGNQY